MGEHQMCAKPGPVIEPPRWGKVNARPFPGQIVLSPIFPANPWNGLATKKISCSSVLILFLCQCNVGPLFLPAFLERLKGKCSKGKAVLALPVVWTHR